MTRHSFSTVIVLATFAACGGGGGGSSGTIEGLEGPQQVSLVESNSATTGSVRMARGTRAAEGSDYQTDPTRFWIHDDSMKSLETINSILKSLHQTRYYDQTNQGAYRCLVEQDDSGQGGESRGNQAATYEEWIVESSRASNSAPQVVAFWVPQEGGGGGGEPAGTIFGLLTITEAPSDAVPLGVFTLQFKLLADGLPAASADAFFRGYMRSVARDDGQSEIEFFMSGGDPDGSVAPGEMAMRERVHLVRDPVLDQGRAYTEWKHVFNPGGTPFVDEGEYTLQFDGDYVARRDLKTNTDTVLDRNDFDRFVWRYGLYDAVTEDRVEQLSGFPLEDENGNHGWAGFHGLWFPESVTIVDGQTLQRRTFGSGTTVPYTAVVVPGRLEKRTRSTITLGDLLGEDLDMFDPTGGGELRVRFTSSDLLMVAQRSGGSWNEVSPPVSIATSYTSGQWLHFWSRARGGVQLTWPAMLTTSVEAHVWSSTPVTADAPELAGGGMTLHGYQHMLKSAITQDEANFLAGESPYFPDATGVSTGNQTYFFDRTTLMLTLGGVDVDLGTGVAITQGPGMFGLNCGPLFTEPLGSLNEFGSASVTYEWSIGPNQWNQLRTLKDQNGAFVAFTPPLRFDYVHDESGSPFDGRTFFMEWDGSNLHGVPHEEAANGRWYPVFTIPNGTTLTSGGTTYLVKQLEGEELMVAVADPAAVIVARGFDLSVLLTAPTATPYVDPGIGEMPVITDGPRYVGGVLQTADE